MDRRVTSPIWGTPPPCKQTLSQLRWALINFVCWNGRLLEVAAKSRLGAYSKKYGKLNCERFFF